MIYKDRFVEIFCDANNEIGLGHLKRSSALAAHLQKQGIETRLTGLSSFSQSILPVQANIDRKASVVVFDSHEGIDANIQNAGKNGETTVTLDWFGETVPDINIVVYPHQAVHAVQKIYVGFEYIIIREAIRSVDEKTVTGNADKVLVCLGGGDRLGQGYEAAEIISDLGFDVTLVQGPLAKQKKENRKFQLLIDPPDFPELLAGCDWAVTNGGGCFFEALYLGKPAFVLPQTEFEMRIATYAGEHASVLGIGLRSITNFLPGELQRISTNGKKLIDGYGLDRISTIIKDLL